MRSGANTASLIPFFLPINPQTPNNISNISISDQTSVEPIPLLKLRMGISIGISLHPYIGIGINSNIYPREYAHIT